MGNKNGKSRQSVYLPREILAELIAEAARQDRSVSWLLQQAWRIGRAQIEKLPITKEVPDVAADES